jgi:hypothetical protein
MGKERKDIINKTSAGEWVSCFGVSYFFNLSKIIITKSSIVRP